MAKKMQLIGLSHTVTYNTFDPWLNIELKDIKQGDTFVVSDEKAKALLEDFAKAGPGGRAAFQMVEDKVADPPKGPTPSAGRKRPE